MHVVVVGLGQVGRHVVRELRAEGHDVVAIDSDQRATQYVEDHFDVATVTGHAGNEDVLREADVANSQLVAAVTSRDEVNLICALAAKGMGARQVIARAQGTEWASWDTGVRHGLLGVDVVVNPRVLVAQELGRIARSHGASEVRLLAKDRLELAEVALTEHTLYLDVPLSTIRMPKGCLVAAIARQHELIIPQGSDSLREGDLVFLIGTPAGVLDAEDLLTSKREAKRILAVGGGAIGLAFARAAEGAEITIIERDLAVAERVAAELPNVRVIHGDGAETEVLEEEEVDSYDLFAALTSDDQTNLMASLLAQRAGVGRVATVVSKPAHVDIYRRLGIHTVLSPRTVCSDHILRYARAARVKGLTSILNGAAEVIEVQAGNGPAIGVPLKDAGFPRGALIAAIVRNGGDDDGEVVVARGNDVVRHGDRVVVLTQRDMREQVETLLGCKR